MPLTLQQLNASGGGEAGRLLDGVYEQSPWIAEAALAHRPFKSLPHLKCVLARIVAEAGRDAQIALLQAHPRLGQRSDQPLTGEAGGEQARSGLAECTPVQAQKLGQLSAAYEARFGFPFVLALRGPRDRGLTGREIIGALERRLDNPTEVELGESLRNVHRIAELRLNDRFAAVPELGNRVWDWLEALAQHSDPGYQEQGQLTVTYLTQAHRQVAARISQHMRESGFDEVGIDAVGNVVGVYSSSAPTRSPGAGRAREGSSHMTGLPASSRRLLTGSHYDTVRNGGRYDGRLGILTPLACVSELARQGRRLPFDIEVVAHSPAASTRRGWTRRTPTA